MPAHTVIPPINNDNPDGAYQRPIQLSLSPGNSMLVLNADGELDSTALSVYHNHDEPSNPGAPNFGAVVILALGFALATCDQRITSIVREFLDDVSNGTVDIDRLDPDLAEQLRSHLRHMP